MLHAAHRTWMGASQNHLSWISTAGTLAHLGAKAAQSLNKHRGLSVDVRAPHDARLLEGLVLFRLVPERGGVHRVEGACIPREMGYGYKVWLVTVLWCVRYPLRETATTWQIVFR